MQSADPSSHPPDGFDPATPVRPDDSPLRPGTAFGAYDIQSVLGEGGAARVYLAKHREDGILYALKVLNSPSASLRDRMLREGHLQSRLRHRNIVGVREVLHPTDGSHPPALVLEYINGPNLDTLVGKRALEIDEIDQIANGLFRAVRYAHAHGLVHRDLKPANIMLAFEGDRIIPKLTDFGLVKDVHGESSTQLGIALGTPRYMSPEQIRDSGSVDVRSDVFALGAVVSFMLTRRNAFGHGVEDVCEVFTAIMEADVDAHIDAIRQARPDAPQRMLDAVRGALTRERSERLARVSVLSAVFSGRETLRAATPSPAESSESPLERGLDDTIDPESSEPVVRARWPAQIPRDIGTRMALAAAVAVLLGFGLMAIAAALF